MKYIIILLLLCLYGCLQSNNSASTLQHSNQKEDLYSDNANHTLSSEQTNRLEEYKKVRNKSNNKNNLLNLDRPDIIKAYRAYRSSLSQIENYLNSSPHQLANFIAQENQWENYRIQQDINYLKQTHPFFDDKRLAAIALFARAYKNGKLLENINNNISSNEITSTELLNITAYAFDKGNDYSIITDDLVFCRPKEDDDIFDIAGEVLDKVPGKMASRASWLLDAASFLYDTTHTFTCHSRNGVKKYNVYMLYSRGNRKFFEKEEKTIDLKKAGKFVFSTTTPISNLDYIAIEALGEIGNEPVRNLTVYQIGNQKMNLIDKSTFINNILPRYQPN